jgi:hypothetical protein
MPGWRAYTGSSVVGWKEMDDFFILYGPHKRVPSAPHSAHRMKVIPCNHHPTSKSKLNFSHKKLNKYTRCSLN